MDLKGFEKCNRNVYNGQITTNNKHPDMQTLRKISNMMVSHPCTHVNILSQIQITLRYEECQESTHLCLDQDGVWWILFPIYNIPYLVQTKAWHQQVPCLCLNQCWLSWCISNGNASVLHQAINIYIYIKQNLIAILQFHSRLRNIFNSKILNLAEITTHSFWLGLCWNIERIMECAHKCEGNRNQIV